MTEFRDHVDTWTPESKVATFRSKAVKLQLDMVVDKGEAGDGDRLTTVSFRAVKKPGLHGQGLVAQIEIHAGHAVSFVLRDDMENHNTKIITSAILDLKQDDTLTFWHNFIAQSKYTGRWREIVERSLMVLKLMTYGKLSYAEYFFYTQC